MAQRGIREYEGKKILFDGLAKYLPSFEGRSKKLALVRPDTDPKKLLKDNPWLAKEKLVVKPDQLFGKRGKHGLLCLNADWKTAWAWITERMNKTVTVGHTTGELQDFLIEPFTPHRDDEEGYVAIRAARDGDTIYLSDKGGIYVEENWGAVKETEVPILASIDDVKLNMPDLGPRTAQVAEFVKALYKVYAEVKNGYTFHWLKSVEHKTKKGLVEFLIPAIGLEILRVLERWSEPHRAKLAAQLAEWELDQEEKTPKRLRQIAAARANRDKLFLGNGGNGVVPVPGTAWGDCLRAFATAAGVQWALAAHQMRRLYAYTFCRHRLGGLLFLKEQFKHSSINMSQLYAANPNQDVALYDEILKEVRLHKIKTIAGWTNGGELLAGGAGKKIMALRAHDFPNRAAMIEETADRITIRSTGHSWCLAQDEGCGGSGIYEKGRCGRCHNGLIDGHFKPFWQETYKHQKELLDEAQKLGPGAVKRVQRDLDEAAWVLNDMCVELTEEVPNASAAAK